MSGLKDAVSECISEKVGEGYDQEQATAMCLTMAEEGRLDYDPRTKEAPRPEDQKHLNVKLDVKTLDEGGIFEGYASVFGVEDYDGDVIVRGAFRKTIENYKDANTMPKMLWQHDPNEIIGVWMDMHEDEHGLYVKGRILMDIQRGREAYALMKAGVLDEMSIGFNIGEAEPSPDRSHGRVINDVNLWEVSLVTWAANPQAKVQAVKGHGTITDFERFLRDAGYSRKQAKAIASQGYNAAFEQRDADSELVNDLKSLTETLKQLRGDSDE